jgi:large subunit ribosomal protein L7/L12
MSEVATELKEIGDKIATLTLKQAKELTDYLEEAHGIKAAAGGGGGGGGGAAAAPVAAVEQTEFDVVMTSFGEKKLDVVKVVKDLTGASLMDAKKLVEGVPSKIKEKVSKEEATSLKTKLEAAGAKIDLK